MSLEGKGDPAESVRARLLRITKERGEDHQQVLVQYATERFLYRLSLSPYREKFVLKGARLFEFWTGERHRPTRDIDFLSHSSPLVSELLPIFQEICATTISERDGIVFPPDRISGEPAREGQDYQGASFKIAAQLGSAVIPVQIDLGFGDAVTPGPQIISLPTLLSMPNPRLLAYPRETVIAEKLQAMATLGIANSRMKDFYDVWYLAQRFDFDGVTLSAAVKATFERRKSGITLKAPIAFTSAFTSDAGKRVQWNAFVKRNRLTGEGTTLQEVVEVLQIFLLPVLKAVASDQVFTSTWRSEVQVWEAPSVVP